MLDTIGPPRLIPSLGQHRTSHELLAAAEDTKRVGCDLLPPSSGCRIYFAVGSDLDENSAAWPETPVPRRDALAIPVKTKTGPCILRLRLRSTTARFFFSSACARVWPKISPLCQTGASRLSENEEGLQNHWSECGRATSVQNPGALGRPHRSVLALGPGRVDPKAKVHNLLLWLATLGILRGSRIS